MLLFYRLAIRLSFMIIRYRTTNTITFIPQLAVIAVIVSMSTIVAMRDISGKTLLVPYRKWETT